MELKNNFEEFSYKLYKEKNKEIFSFYYEDKKYWLKKARKTKSNFLHKFIYRIFGMDLLVPVLEKNAQESIKFETTKIDKLRLNKINTPNIKLININFFVLEDCGRTINSYLKKENMTKSEIHNLLELGLIELSKIHNCNEFHGGPQIRNFTFLNGVVFTIDFEESFSNKIDLEVLQFRDLVLFLMSISRLKLNYDINYNYLINKYIELVPQNKYFINKLLNLAKKISFFISFSQINFFNRIIGKEARSFFKLFSILEKLEG